MAEEWTKVETDIWTHEEGSELTGIYLGVQTEVGVNKSNLYKIETSEGKQIGVWGCKVLDDAMFGMKSGTQVKILYKGKVKPEKGNEYRSYEVFTKLSK